MMKPGDGGLACHNSAGSQPSALARRPLAWLQTLCQGGCCWPPLGVQEPPILTSAWLSFMLELPFSIPPADSLPKPQPCQWHVPRHHQTPPQTTQHCLVGERWGCALSLGDSLS